MMYEDQSLSQAINAAIELSEYDNSWPAAFEAERRYLEKVCSGQLVAIEHIGSTAVSGMIAKPVIDILAGVETLQIADSLLEPLCGSGYTTSAEFNATIGNRRWLMRWKDGRRTHHLHLVVHNSADWSDQLKFRDILRSNDVVASQYHEVKVELAAIFQSDREAYTDGKSEFIRDVLEQYAI